MKLDNWLAQRAQSCPERTALVTEASSVTYAELEAEATWVARRLAAYGVRREATAALTMHPRREEVVLLHALMKLGAVALPLSPRLTDAERGGRARRRAPRGRPQRRRRARPRPRPTCRCSASTTWTTSTADPDQRHLRRAAAGRPHLRELPLQRGRLRLQHRGRTRRPLALLPAAQPRRRALDRPALGDLRDHRGAARRLRHRPGRGDARARAGSRCSRWCRRC